MLERVIDEAKQDLAERAEYLDIKQLSSRYSMSVPEVEQNFVKDKRKIIDAKAELIRATMANRPVNSDVLQVLGDNSTTKGNKFLPSTLTNDIIAEPLVKNQLREKEIVTQITNLVIPRISFTIDDDDFIQDGEAAKEIELKGDSVNFGRFQTKVKAGITDTVLMGTNTNLVQTVENNLRAGLAAKERKVSFATSPKSGEEHMSFYDKTEVNIKEVEGNDLYEAITNALADLHEDFRENATIYMRFTDYVTIIRTLANGSATLYNAQPEQVLGKPVIFTDAATTPVVGDFSYAHLNYDIGAYAELKTKTTGITGVINKTSDVLQKVGNSAQNIGTSLTHGVTIPIAGAVTAVTTAAVKWESAFAGVISLPSLVAI